jgi:small subunit ribosomal protein S15
MLEKKKKQTIIKKFQTHAGDTGSNEVQIAILVAEIEELANHLKTHPKDHSSRRGLLRKVSSRRNLMRYLKKENPESYEKLIKKLKIKPVRTISKPDGGTSVSAEEELADEMELIGKNNESAN